MKTVGIRLDEKLVKFLEKQAKKQGYLFSGYVRNLLIEHKRKLENATKQIDIRSEVSNVNI